MLYIHTHVIYILFYIACYTCPAGVYMYIDEGHIYGLCCCVNHIYVPEVFVCHRCLYTYTRILWICYIREYIYIIV